jgi:hypothetical protein
MLIFRAQKRVEEDEGKIVSKKNMQRLQDREKIWNSFCYL